MFEAHTPQLNARFSDLPESIYRSPPAQKLDIGKPSRDERGSEYRMRRLWEDWNGARLTLARADFDKLLEENQFVGFWAGVKRMAKEAKTGDGTIIPGVDPTEEDEEDEEGEGGGGKADLKALAKGIGEKQIEDVLKVRALMTQTPPSTCLTSVISFSDSTISDTKCGITPRRKGSDGSRRVV